MVGGAAVCWRRYGEGVGVGPGRAAPVHRHEDLRSRDRRGVVTASAAHRAAVADGERGITGLADLSGGRMVVVRVGPTPSAVTLPAALEPTLALPVPDEAATADDQRAAPVIPRKGCRETEIEQSRAGPGHRHGAGRAGIVGNDRIARLIVPPFWSVSAPVPPSPTNNPLVSAPGRCDHRAAGPDPCVRAGHGNAAGPIAGGEPVSRRRAVPLLAWSALAPGMRPPAPARSATERQAAPSAARADAPLPCG